MKKVISILIVLVLTFALFCVPASAEGTGTLALSNTEGKQGDTVVVNVNLNSNPGLTTMKFKVSWEDGLELTGVSNSGLLAGWTTPAPTISSPYTLRWADSLSTVNSTKTGKIATLTFKIKDNATVGNKNVTLTFNESYDANGGKNSFGNATATIKVNCKTHSYGTYTKSSDTQHSRTCSVCGNVEKTNHTWNGGTVTKAATCKETGVKTYTCTGCGATKTETIAKTTSHSYGSYKTTKEATCTAKGTETATCSVCGVTTSRSVPATGHKYGSWTTSKEATCTAQGTQVRTCSKCGNKETKSIAALGHSFSKSTVTKEPTCTVAGEKTGKCTRCGKTTKETIKAKGHSFGAWADETAATCTKGGTQKRVCKVCKAEEKRNTEALGHDFDSPVVVKEPTIYSTGLMQGKCKRCGETTDEIIPCTYTDGNNNVKFEAQEGVFTEGTEITVEPIDVKSEVYKSAKNVLSEISEEFIVYDISALKEGAKVQPNGKVKVTFDIPEGYGKDVAIYYVSDDGTYEKIDGTVSEDGKTIVAELEHFSFYAVCKLGTAKTADASKDTAIGTQNGNNSMIWIIVGIVAACVIIAVIVIASVKKKKATN